MRASQVVTPVALALQTACCWIGPRADPTPTGVLAASSPHTCASTMSPTPGKPPPFGDSGASANSANVVTLSATSERCGVFSVLFENRSKQRVQIPDGVWIGLAGSTERRHRLLVDVTPTISTACIITKSPPSDANKATRSLEPGERHGYLSISILGCYEFKKDAAFEVRLTYESDGLALETRFEMKC